jgi:hypothetical protein
MSSSESLARSPIAAPYAMAPGVALDTDFNARWAAWLARGQAHEKSVRRKLLLFAGVLTMAAAIVYAFLS